MYRIIHVVAKFRHNGHFQLSWHIFDFIVADQGSITVEVKLGLIVA
jgi:hypothetical protein